MNSAKDIGKIAGKEYDPEVTKLILLHIDGIFHQRINIFLVAESIFFAGVVAGWQSGQNLLKISISIMGLLFTMFLMHTLIRLRIGLDFLVNQYKKSEKSKLYKDYTEIEAPGMRSARVFTQVMPWLFIAFWIALIALASFS